MRIRTASWPLMYAAPILDSAAEPITLGVMRENGLDGTVETRTSGGWLGHVRSNVTHEIVSTSAAAGSRFGEVGGFAVNVGDNFSGGIPNCGVGVCGGVIEQPYCVGIGLFRASCLLCIYRAKGGDHGGVDCNRILQESSDDFL